MSSRQKQTYVFCCIWVHLSGYCFLHNMLLIYLFSAFEQYVCYLLATLVIVKLLLNIIWLAFVCSFVLFSTSWLLFFGDS